MKFYNLEEVLDYAAEKNNIDDETIEVFNEETELKINIKQLNDSDNTMKFDSRNFINFFKTLNEENNKNKRELIDNMYFSKLVKIENIKLSFIVDNKKFKIKIKKAEGFIYGNIIPDVVDSVGYLCFELRDGNCSEAFQFCYKIGQDELTFIGCDDNEKEVQFFKFKKIKKNKNLRRKDEN